MSISGLVIEQSYEGVGQLGTTYQRDVATTPALYCRLIVGNVVNSDATYKFTMNSVFKYYGYEDLVFWEQGYFLLDSSGNWINKSFAATSGAADYQTGCLYTYNGGAQMTAGAGSQGIWLGECTFTVPKPSSGAIVPYVKIGGIGKWTSDYTAGNLWVWGNEYGCMVINSITSQHDWYGLTATFNGVTKSIQCMTVTGTTTTSCNFNLSSSLIKVTRTYPIWVANSSGKYSKAKGVSVFPSGSKKAAKSVTCYDSSGKGHTISMQ